MGSMIKICEQCDKEFNIKPSEEKTRFCCSAVCGYKRLTKYKFGIGTSVRNENGQTRKEIQFLYRNRLRKSMLVALGGVCVNCGFEDMRALQVDHINGGGKKERRKIPNVNEFYQIVVNSFLKEENKYQLLCANCNVIKRIINKENR